MLATFRQFLSIKERVPERNIPYYLKWVSDCYRFFNLSEMTPLENHQRAQFLTHLAKNHEDWQVEQADRALRLYEYFLSKTKTDQNEPVADLSGDWKRLEDKTREALKLRHRSYSTEKTYILWLRQFRDFLKERDPLSLKGRDLQDFLSQLAVEKKVSASTQNQALNAIVFFYRHVLDKDIEGEISGVRARQNRRLPVVLTTKEVDRIFSAMSGVNQLVVRLIYGCGLRLQECLQLRIKDLDLEQNIVIVRSGKGDKDRRTVFPEAIKEEIIHHLAEVRKLYEKDREAKLSGVYLPGALDRKYPNAGKEWGWFSV